MIRTLRQTNTGLKRVVSASMREGRLEATPTTRSQCGFLRKLLCLYTPLLLVLLAGCANPYSVSINKINYKAEQKKGIIQFTDPKLYKREALINERRDELAYLKDLLDKSRTQDFKPEIVRELEVITAFSAAMGLKFDPAAAITFERDKETSELVHQIELTRLEMELAQLQRDATLLKEQLEQQKDLMKPNCASKRLLRLIRKIHKGISTWLSSIMTMVT